MPDSLLLKFQKLPDLTKSRASDPEAMRVLDQLEKDFSLNLAELVMRVLVKEVAPEKIDEALNLQYSVDRTKAKEVAQAMLDRLFFHFHLLELPDVSQDKSKEGEPLKPQSGANPYLVHPDDEKDILTHQKFLQNPPAQTVDTDFEKVVNRIVQMERLQLDEITKRRFEKVIESRLVDVRDKLETRDILVRSEKIGGMGFDDARAERIVAELERVVEEIHRRPKPVIEKPKPAIQPKPIPPPPPPPPKVQVDLKPKAENEIPKPVPKPVMPKPPEIQSTPVSISTIEKPKKIVAPPPWFRPSNIPAVAQPSQPVQSAVTFKPKPIAPPQPSYQEMVTDVRAPVKVMGPIEVLASLTLEDFRRLGVDPEARTKKIIDEIEALGKDSFGQKAAGIQAWRKSPTFQNYLQIGQMAMEKKEDLTDIIQLLKAQGKPSLGTDEFEAIGALMRQFRF
ncbi:MAG: hypothetical protein WCT08_02795 [Patescibacteria group bacterium]|jgi:hypothetical protein